MIDSDSPLVRSSTSYATETIGTELSFTLGNDPTLLIQGHQCRKSESMTLFEMRTFFPGLRRRTSRHLLRIILCLTIFQAQINHTISSVTAQTNIMDPQGNGLESLLHDLRQKYKHQPVFLQSVNEIAHSLTPLFQDPDKGEFYKRVFVVMTEPERTISFRVRWEDDAGNMRYNRGWRVQFSRYVGEKALDRPTIRSAQ